MNDIQYSVLMSVYNKEKPEYLRDSVKSMLEQTITPAEIILVKDGPLTKELDDVIDEFKTNDIIKVISIKHNVGLGNALRIGLEECSYDFVARMDSDDLSVPDRCEKQLHELLINRDISVVGSAIAEFIDSSSNIVAYKPAIEQHSDIIKRMKYRNAMNHPSVMFRKNDVLNAGNYKHWHLNEDYYLWIRMINKGYKFKNINEPLVKMRMTNDTYLRRGGWKYFIAQKGLYRYMWQTKFINVFEYLFNYFVCLGSRVLIPNKVRKFLYLKILREPVRK